MQEQRTIAHPVVHLRAAPQGDSELVSQTLMGRQVRVLEVSGSWSYVETDDTYRGWAESRWLVDMESNRSLTPIGTVFAEMREAPRVHAPLLMRLPIGAAVHMRPPHSFKEEWVAATLPDGKTHGWLPAVVFPSVLPRTPAEMIAKTAASRSRDFRGTPYLWGGTTSFGLDCSGFVQICYRLSGMILRRDADIQRDDPRFVPIPATKNTPGDLLLPGDLVFFGKPDNITHVGMHLEDGKFIHAAGGAGVIVTEWGDDRYTPGFVDARRLDVKMANVPVTRPDASEPLPIAPEPPPEELSPTTTALTEPTTVEPGAMAPISAELPFDSPEPGAAPPLEVVRTPEATPVAAPEPGERSRPPRRASNS